MQSIRRCSIRVSDSAGSFQGNRRWRKNTWAWLLTIALAVTSVPLLAQFAPTEQHFCQVVLNQGSTTSFTIHNPSSTKTITVDANLYFPNGSALADGQVVLGPGATDTLSFGDAEAALTRGWAMLKSDDEFIATEFFQLFIGQPKPRVGVLPSAPSEEIRFVGFVNPQLRSGLALHNPSSTEATRVTVRIKNKAGQEPVGAKQLQLAPLQSESAFLNDDLFFGTGLSDFEGVVEISVNSPPVAALSLIQEANGDVATVSVLTERHIITDGTNTALGVDAFVSNTTGSENTATGGGALYSNTTGDSNTATGFLALRSNTEGVNNTASGVNALAANTTGNFNTAFGVDALVSNTTGSENTATGGYALSSNTEGASNTATGNGALTANTTGSQNTATGYLALVNNTTGSENTVTGVNALFSNTTGFENTAAGFNALAANTTGSLNTASGVNALAANTTGNLNTAFGWHALALNTVSEGNTASGSQTLALNTTGSDNSASGHRALRRNTTGSRNTASGVRALAFNTTGSDNIAIGYEAGVGSAGNGNNNIHIGNPGGTESNIIRIGNTSHTNAFIAGVSIVPPSSRRFKENIRNMDAASTDLMRLRPVSFRYKKEYDSGDSRRQYGLVAEEVAEIYPELVVNDDKGQARTVMYQSLNVMLLNELQKQHRQIQELIERLSLLERDQPTNRPGSSADINGSEAVAGAGQ